MTHTSRSALRGSTRRLALAVATVATAASAVLVTGCGQTSHQAYGVRAVPPTPTAVATGIAYPYYLQIRCGIRFAQFAGHWWEADSPGPAPSAAGTYPEAYGTMTLIDATHARFQGEGVPTVDFHTYPYDSVPTMCSQGPSAAGQQPTPPGVY